MAFALTNPLRRGGPLCPPEQIDVAYFDGVRPCASLHGRDIDMPMADFDDIGACAVDASRVCRGRRMVREIR